MCLFNNYTENVQQVHEDLYNPSSPNDPNSDTYLMLIIQSVFSLKGYSTANAILTRAVLEAIFDENYLSTKRLTANAEHQAKVKM